PLAALKLRAALFEDASGIFADFPQKFLPQLLILKQLLAVHFSVAVIDPKEKVEEYAKDRDEYHKQQVGEGFYVAVCIVDNAQANQHQHQDVQGFKKQQPENMIFGHLSPVFFKKLLSSFLPWIRRYKPRIVSRLYSRSRPRCMTVELSKPGFR